MRQVQKCRATQREFTIMHTHKARHVTGDSSTHNNWNLPMKATVSTTSHNVSQRKKQQTTYAVKETRQHGHVQWRIKEH